MGLSQKEEKLAVDCGYWQLYRYNPTLEGTDKNPFSLDSKEPDFDKFEEFLENETRFSQLPKIKGEEAAKELLEKTRKDAEYRYQRLLNLRDGK